MHPADINAAIRKAGDTQTSISKRAGVTKASVNGVMSGRGRNKRIEGLISEATGLPLHELWPQHYSADGAEPQPQSLADQIQAINARLAAIESRLNATAPSTHEFLGLLSGAIRNALEAHTPSTDRS